MDLGASRRGVDMGPYSVRVAGLDPKLRQLGYTVKDEGNVMVKLAEQLLVGDPKLRFLDPIAQVCRELSAQVAAAQDQGDITIAIGGDHSIAIGSLAGVSHSFQAKKKNLGLIWFDAHADFNTPDTTVSGNIHGMPLAALMGYGSPVLTSIGGDGAKFSPHHVVHIGGRDIEAQERRLIKEAGITVYTMREVDEKGVSKVMQEAIQLATHGTDGFAVSIDVDGFDPAWVPGVGTPVLGGLSYREAHLAMEMIADTRRLVHIDLVEINPLLDHRNQTSEMGVELIMSALGKQIM